MHQSGAINAAKETLATSVSHFSNLDLENLCTPVKAEVFDDLLKKTNYPEEKRKFLIKGFTSGFSLGYKGPMNRKDTSNNIPFTIGNKYELWEKIMKEVKLGRYAGPFEKIPFDHYVQSPVGLVPKAGNQTRLIFHLSYKFENGNELINFWTLKEICTVKYNDIDHTVQNFLNLIRELKNSPIRG